MVRDHDTGSGKVGSLGEGVHGRCFAETVHGSRLLACSVWFVPLPTRRFTPQSVKNLAELLVRNGLARISGLSL